MYIAFYRLKKNLSAIVRDFKTFTSKQIISSIKEEPESRREWILFQFKRAAQQHKRNDYYQVWTHENHAVELENNIMIDQHVNYIHNNAVEAGYVDELHHYVNSSAKDYARDKGLVYTELL